MAKVNFLTYGPFDIDTEYGRVTKKQETPWADAEKARAGLSDAKGCYVYVVKSSGATSPLPYYVGRTNKASFKSEAIGSHQRELYNAHLWNRERARPQLFLIPKLTKNNALFRGKVGKDIEELEYYLIALALGVNPNLLNKRDTMFFRDLVLPGVLNSPQRRPRESELSFAKTFRF